MTEAHANVSISPQRTPASLSDRRSPPTRRGRRRRSSSRRPATTRRRRASSRRSSTTSARRACTTRSGARRFGFDRLDPYAGTWIQAKGEFADAGGEVRRVAVAIGPEHGTVEPGQVKEAAGGHARQRPLRPGAADAAGRHRRGRAWASLYATESRTFPVPETGRVAVKVINHYGDEVMQVYEVATPI